VVHEEPGGLTIRRAEPDDADRLASLMFLAPTREPVAMAGSATGAERFCASLFRRALVAGTSVVIVAETSEPVGFAEVSGADSPFGAVARAAVDALGVIGALRAGWRSLARLKVDLSAPEGGIHLVELQVSPQHRNRGVGALLLRQVDDYATEQRAAHISLTTAIDNPARRLYERSGYRVTGEKTYPRYERITGSAGRVLMVKPLSMPSRGNVASG
jgi:ribosomal protein S18 acetylase RimI-like enzyme